MAKAARVSFRNSGRGSLKLVCVDGPPIVIAEGQEKSVWSFAGRFWRSKPVRRRWTTVGRTRMELRER